MVQDNKKTIECDLIATFTVNEEGKKVITSIRFAHDRKFQNMMDQAWLRTVNAKR